MCLGAPMPQPVDPKYCNVDPLPPHTGSCCAYEANCYYYVPEPPDDCPPDQCCPGQNSPGGEVGDPISVLTFEVKERENDLSFSSPHEGGFKLFRRYRSRITRDSAIGFGWTHNYNVILSTKADAGPSLLQIQDESNQIYYFQDLAGTGSFSGVFSTSGTLARNADNTYTWHRANGIDYTFNAQMQFIAKTDGNGHVQSLTYNSNGLLQTVTDQATGRSIGFHYNADNRIDSITGPVTAAVPDGVWVSYQYDTNGNLTRVTYADDSGFQYKYECAFDSHNLTVICQNTIIPFAELAVVEFRAIFAPLPN